MSSTLFASRAAAFNSLVQLVRDDIPLTSRLHSPAPWVQSASLAIEHDVLGLVYRSACLSPFFRDGIREDFIEAARSEVSRGLHLSMELLSLEAEFRRRRLPMLALKGPVISVLAHGQPASRSFCDLDLLVAPEVLEQASELILAQGYRRYVPTYDETLGCHRVFVRDRDNATVELHWELFPAALAWPLQQTGIWERSQRVMIQGHAIPTLGLEDTVIFLCLHGLKHRWSRLKWVCDLKFALRSDSQVDWNTVVLRSKAIGCFRAVLIGLILAAELLLIELPISLRRERRHYLAARAMAARFRQALINGTVADGAELLIYQVHCRDRNSDRRAILRQAFVTKWRPNHQDMRVMQLPAALSGLYYLIRPLRLLSMYGLGWVKPLILGR